MQATPELRPLGVGDIVDRVFTVYRMRFGPLLAVAAVPYLVFAIGAGAIGFAAAPSLAAFITQSSRLQGRTTIPPSELTSFLATMADLIPLFAGIGLIAIAFSLVQAAALVRITAAAYLGQSVTIGQALGTGISAFPRLLLMGIAAVLAFVVMWTVGIIAIALLATVSGSVAGALVAAVLGLGLVVATVFLQASWMVSPAVLILERTGPVQSLGRAFHLTGGSRWRVLGLQMLLFILQVVLSSVLSVLLVAALGSDQTVRFALQQAVNLLASIVWAPIYWGTFAVLYYDLRVRKEAFDLQLAAEALPRDT